MTICQHFFKSQNTAWKLNIFAFSSTLYFLPITVMPFLMLGIGIDDMFVIVQSWETLKPEERSLSLIERFGVTMRHAGAAITVTSVTDIIAFGIGGFTVLPALQSFCIYASVGIVVMHVPDQD